MKRDEESGEGSGSEDETSTSSESESSSSESEGTESTRSPYFQPVNASQPQGANGQPLMSLSQNGGIRFQLPGRIQHKTTITLTHHPDGNITTSDTDNTPITLEIPDGSSTSINPTANQGPIPPPPPPPPPMPGYGYDPTMASMMPQIPYCPTQVPYPNYMGCYSYPYSYPGYY